MRPGRRAWRVTRYNTTDAARPWRCQYARFDSSVFNKLMTMSKEERKWDVNETNAMQLYTDYEARRRAAAAMLSSTRTAKFLHRATNLPYPTTSSPGRGWGDFPYLPPPPTPRRECGTTFTIYYLSTQTYLTSDNVTVLKTSSLSLAIIYSQIL